MFWFLISALETLSRVSREATPGFMEDTVAPCVVGVSDTPKGKRISLNMWLSSFESVLWLHWSVCYLHQL